LSNPNPSARRVQETNVIDRAGTFAIVKSLDLAIWLSMPQPQGPGMQVEDAVMVGRGRHEITFHDPARRARYHQLDFFNGVAKGSYIEWAKQQRELKQTIRKMIQGKEPSHARTNSR